MTLKQGQGHQPWYILVDPKQCYNHAKFEEPPLKNLHEKANVKAFVKSVNVKGRLFFSK